jgi:putative oxidoreductase
MNTFFSPVPISVNKTLAIIRIIIGLLLIYHGQEVFNPELMKGYSEWDTFKGKPAMLMVYAGKGSELLAGISLLAGLFTRLGALLTVGTFSYITFFVGHGKFWYDDQHPFMFLLFGLLFLFTGPGDWSADGLIFRNKGIEKST